MALINKIREKSGIAVGIITVGLGLFVLGGDLLRPGQSSRPDTEVGEIAGESISMEEYQQVVQEMVTAYKLRNNQNPSEADMASIRQQAWDMMIVRTAFQQQYDALGIEVTDEELVDMVHGKNIHPDILQSFVNPETGIFDRDRLNYFLNNLNQASPQQQAAWYSLQNSLAPARLRVKYDNLMVKATYVTEAEAAQEYQAQNATVDTKFVYVPYASINDSTVKVSEDELKAYIKEHEEEYKVEEGRSLSYVTFPVTPSAQDSAYYREDLGKLKAKFVETDNDSIFASLNTEGGIGYQRMTIDMLPAQLADEAPSLSEGDVRGPFLLGSSYFLYKISKIGEADKAVAKASHILIKAENDSDEAKKEAKKEAREVLRKARSGADFSQLALEYSDGPTKTRGGNLGWFAEGRMVPEFNDAVFGQNRAGVINKVVETQFGYHIINVEEPKTNKEFGVAVIRRDITSSDQTIDEAYKKADLFAASSSDYEEFKKNAEEMGLQVRGANDLTSDETRVGASGNARQVVRWLYNDASMQQVSEVFDLENAYMVAVMTGKHDAGVASLSKVKQQVKQKVINRKKAEMIKEKLTGATLEEIASNYGNGAKIATASALTMNSNMLPGAGFSPEAIGTAFGMEINEISEPIAGDNAVVVIQTLAKTPASEIADYSTYKQPIQQKYESRASYNMSEAVRENADIEDKRYKFY